MRSSFIKSQDGVTVVEAAYVMPVILIVLMMLFEFARMALVVIIGNLALETTLEDLRLDASLDLKNASIIEPKIKAAVVDASFGYLKTSDIENIEAISYANLSDFGAALAGEEGQDEEDDGENEDSEDESDSSYPVVTVDMRISQSWLTALPSLLGLNDKCSYTYHGILGNLYQRYDET